MKTLFLDLETTGLNPETCAIWQIGGVIDVDGVELGSFKYHVCPHPGAVINQEALDIGGISTKDLESYPEPVEVMNEFIELLNKFAAAPYGYSSEKFNLVGHNLLGFDLKFLGWFFYRLGYRLDEWFHKPEKWNDTLSISRNLLWHLPKRSLKHVAEACGISYIEDNFHDALYDAYICRKIYYALQHIRA